MSSHLFNQVSMPALLCRRRCMIATAAQPWGLEAADEVLSSMVHYYYDSALVGMGSQLGADSSNDWLPG